MLRAQIAMTFDDTPLPDTILKEGRILLQSSAHAVKRVMAKLRPVEVEAWIGEHGFSDGMLARELLHIAQR